MTDDGGIGVMSPGAPKPLAAPSATLMALSPSQPPDSTPFGPPARRSPSPRLLPAEMFWGVPNAPPAGRRATNAPFSLAQPAARVLSEANVRLTSVSKPWLPLSSSVGSPKVAAPAGRIATRTRYFGAARRQPMANVPSGAAAATAGS